MLRFDQATASGHKEGGEASAAPMRLEGGNTRVVFHLGIELQKLQATFNYESADVAPLASLSVQARTPAVSCTPYLDTACGNRIADCDVDEHVAEMLA